MSSLRTLFDKPEFSWLKRKLQLMGSWRKEIVREHRYALPRTGTMPEEMEKCQEFMDIMTQLKKPYLPQSSITPSSTLSLQPTLFREMCVEQDHVFVGRILELTSIEPPVHIGITTICMIVEDMDGEAQKCNIYNFRSPEDKQIQEFFGVGCKFSVAHPYLRYGFLDNKPCVIVRDPKMITFHPEKRVKSACSYCQKEDPKKRCSQCRKSYYCDNFCQRQDWKVMNHKEICTGKVLSESYCVEVEDPSCSRSYQNAE